MELYKWVKASEKPKEADLYPCLCEKNEHGVKTQTITFGEFRKHYDKIKVDEEKYGEVIEWLKPLPESEQDELWGELSDVFYDSKKAHDYKDGKIDFRLIREWFLKQKSKYHLIKK